MEDMAKEETQELDTGMKAEAKVPSPLTGIKGKAPTP